MSFKIDISYAHEKHFNSFYDALNSVAKEKIYIEMIKAPPFAQVVNFQNNLIEKNNPTYFALYNQKVVGWCDITRKDNPRTQHRGSLGMGLLPEFRGMGIGPRLMETAIEQAKKTGIEKVELQVYTSNIRAIKLYKKFGFEEEGLVKHFRKLDGQYFDCLNMYKFL
jgi:ribosomal protein S18 acetylase RimI-like enzyme